MKTFVTVIQVSATNFDVFKFNCETMKSIYPLSSKKGITVTLFESNEQNDKYCFEMADILNKQID